MYRNAEGYADPTAGEALSRNIDDFYRQQRKKRRQREKERKKAIKNKTKPPAE